ncbi:paramyosin-like [Halichondria panicea]|uniref:paramyosin-like n=1 Tax=Halichondria panicea TaxID=6063 RepID=UPI00312B5531
MAASKESEIKDKYDDKGHEKDDTECKRKDRRCNCMILQVGATVIIGILAVIAIAMSGYSCSLYQKNMAQPKHGSLTDKDWITVRKFIATEVSRGIQEGLSLPLDEFNKTLESFSNRLDDLELRQNMTNGETQVLRAQFRDFQESSEIIQNETSFAISQLSIQANDSTEQIEQLNEVMRETKSELSEQQNLTQIQTDKLRRNVHQLEERQLQTVMDLEELRDDVNETGARVIELSSELTALQNSLASNIAEQTASLKTLINSTEVQLRADLEFVITETRENITALRETDILTKELIANETSELRDHLLLKLDKTQHSLNATEDRLVQSIHEVNSMLQALSIELQESIVNLNNQLEMHDTQNDLALETVHNNLTERISATQERIKLLIYNLNSTERDLKNELGQLAFSAQDNFTKVEHLIDLLSNTSIDSIQQVKIELLQRVDNTESDLIALRENGTIIFETLLNLIHGVNNDLLERYSANNGLIRSLTAEARLNHTQLTATVNNNNEMHTTRLQGLRTDLNGDIDQVSTRLENLRGKATNTQQKVTDLERDVENIKTDTNKLKSGQRSVSDKVRNYHSDASITLSNTTLICLTLIIALMNLL